ncbi:hypothetical protein HN51_052339 [Arachis hypogaea]
MTTRKCVTFHIEHHVVVSRTKGPTQNSEFEHSSIPATIKKMFNLSSNFLTLTLPDVKKTASYPSFRARWFLNGDHFLSSFPDEMSKKMSVKEAHGYVKGAVSRFIRASKEAIKLLLI